MNKSILPNFLTAALIWIAAVPVMGQVIDLNTQPPAADPSAKSMVKVDTGDGQMLIIAIDDPLSGSEIWRSDGTESGTNQIQDILSGVEGSEPISLTPVGDKVFFSARTTGGARNLWVTNGQTSGTSLVKSFPLGNGPDKFTSFNGKLYFEGFTTTQFNGVTPGRELWKSDGTEVGTLQIANINTASGAGAAINHFLNVNNTTLYFTASNGINGREIWTSDGESSTNLLQDIVPGSDTPFLNLDPEMTLMNGNIFFVANTGGSGSELWKTNGTATGAQQVRDIRVGSESATPRSLAVMTVTGAQAGQYVFFSANDGPNGRELWRTDGVVEEPEVHTQMLRNIRTGDQVGSDVNDLTVVGNTLFFTANDGQGVELFKSNGRVSNNAADTGLAVNFNGAADSNPTNLTPFGTKLVFTIHNTAGNLELYYYQAPTGPVSSLLQQFEIGSTASHFTEIDNKLYFLVTRPVATEQGHVTELWVTDGNNAAGTMRVKEFQTGNAGSAVTGLIKVGAEEAYFSGTDGLTGQELWKTDGTQGGTVLVKDIQTGDNSNSSSPESITPSGDKVFFTADGGGNNRELWMTDGTEEGTTVVKLPGDVEIKTDGASSPQHLTNIDGILYFSAIGTLSGREPYQTDGTPGGTTFIDLVPQGSGSNPDQFTSYKNNVYFVADGVGQARSLRNMNDPTITIAPAGSSLGSPTDLVVFAGGGAGGRMFFAANSNKGKELWKSDGTSLGTEIIDINISTPTAGSSPTGLTVAGNFLFFAANNGINGTELWRSNGTATGTAMVADLRKDTPTASSFPEDLMEAGGKLFFTADNGVNGRELWVSNGTAGGTFMLKDIRVGSESAGITNMRNVDGILCFSADDGINGREVWISDGTKTGTSMLENIAPLSASSNPGNFTSFMGQLLFSAADPDAGDELRLTFIGPNIEVRQPSDTLLTLDSTVDFETVKYKATPATLTFTIKNTGRNTLTNVKPLISGVHASEFAFTGAKAATTVTRDATTTFTIKFTPKEGGSRTAIVSILSNDSDENPFVLNLVGNGDKDPTITTHPESLMVKVGDSASFEAAATTSLTPQWKKGSAVIKGAVDTTYSINSVTIKDGGAYIYSVKGTDGVALSNPGELGVVEDNVPPLVIVQGEGKAATFKLNASGNLLSYQWKRDGFNLEDSALIKGATAKTLSIKGLTTADTGLYTCEVTNPGGSQIGGSTQLNVFNAPPSVLDIQNMDNGIVGGNYYHKILIDSDPQKAALSYAAKGLPPGLKLNSKTGEITGRPTKASPLGQPYRVTFTVKNTFNPPSVSSEQLVEIEDFPSNVEGIYAGTVAHNSVLNGDLGGRLDLTITKTGSFSGSLMLGANKVPLKGAVNVFRAEEVLNPKATIELKTSSKSGLPAVITLTFEINKEAGLLTNSKVTGGGEESLIEGWRSVDVASAADYDGYYTFGLKLGDEAQQDTAYEDIIPQGWSFGSFKVAKGKLKMAGRTADGDKITCASFVGVDGNVVFYQTMYTPLKGSLVGKLVIGAQSVVDADDNTLTGDVLWARPADNKSKTRTYVAGFGMPGTPEETPVPLEAAGSIYVKPTGLILGLNSAPADLDLTFTFGGLADANGDDVDAQLLLNTGNKVVQDDTAALTKLATIKSATGDFSGTFALGSGADTRKSSFFGLLITDDGTDKGVGFFTLPQAPVGEETLKTSPIFGGNVELVPVP